MTTATPLGRSTQLQRSSSDYKKLYKTRRWKKLRALHLIKHPYCQCPHHEGQYVKGNVVDHITPHKGDTRLFWNPENLQTLTATCHSRFKQSAEMGGKGFNQGCDAQGNPLNKQDHW